MRKIELNKYERGDVESVSLLSFEEYMAHIYLFPPVFQRWWLRDIHGPYVGSVCDSEFTTVGYVHNYEERSLTSECGIRPVFKIKGLDAQKGEKIVVGDVLCTVIDANLALSDFILELRPFSSGKCDWESSDIKEFIQSEDFLRFIGLDR